MLPECLVQLYETNITPVFTVRTLKLGEGKLLILYELEPEFETRNFCLKSPCLMPLQSSKGTEVAYQEPVWEGR